MIVYLFYSRGSRSQAAVESLAGQLGRRQVDCQIVDADSAEGVALAGTYDILSRPAAVLVGPDGTALERWPNGLPEAGDVSYLVHR